MNSYELFIGALVIGPANKVYSVTSFKPVGGNIEVGLCSVEDKSYFRKDFLKNLKPVPVSHDSLNLFKEFILEVVDDASWFSIEAMPDIKGPMAKFITNDVCEEGCFSEDIEFLFDAEYDSLHFKEVHRFQMHYISITNKELTLK